MRLSQEQTEGIRVAGTVRDIGKIYGPAEILSKPNELSESEFGMIKAHPQAGRDILKEIEFPWPVAQIVLQRHAYRRDTVCHIPQGIAEMAGCPSPAEKEILLIFYAIRGA